MDDDSNHKHYDSNDEHGDQQHEHGMNDNEYKRNITILAVVNSSVENIDNVPQQDSSNEELSSEETSNSADGFDSNAELVFQEVFEGEAEIENSGVRESASNIPSMPTSSTLEMEQQSSSDSEKQNNT